ncbi:hypothetical protein ACLOJK_036960, partial [Asimina triloba]
MLPEHRIRCSITTIKDGSQRCRPTQLQRGSNRTYPNERRCQVDCSIIIQHNPDNIHTIRLMAALFFVNGGMGASPFKSSEQAWAAQSAASCILFLLASSVGFPSPIQICESASKLHLPPRS